jgi:hypothetical protein
VRGPRAEVERVTFALVRLLRLLRRHTEPEVHQMSKRMAGVLLGLMVACNSEVPSAMIELQQGLPPFIVQLKDQVLNLLALLVQKYKY